MKKVIHFRTFILAAFLGVIALIAVSMSILKLYVVKKYIMDQTQEQVKSALNTVRLVYADQVSLIEVPLSLVTPQMNLAEVRDRMRVDYLYVVDAAGVNSSTSEIVKEAARVKRGLGGTRLMSAEELQQIGKDVYAKLTIKIVETPKARKTDKKILDSAMAVEFARPVLDERGEVRQVIYAGKILNRNYDLIDNFRDTVFEKKFYDSKPVGTVTVFQDDVRITTNVLDKNGERAVGTRVSDSVYRRVVEGGGKWFDRAFVVTDWYITAYEPIRNIEGKVIGILYMGLLEKPFVDAGRKVFFVFMTIVFLASLLAAGASYILVNSIVRPLNGVLLTIRKIHDGDLKSQVAARTPIKELNELIVSFNDMAVQLHQREQSLATSNDKLASLNKNYSDLVGFVTHELKGMIASAVLNVYSVKEGFLGPVTEAQKKALNSVGRNLDNLAYTVRNFLNLSRFEKGELAVEKTDILLKQNVLEPAIELFSQQAAAKQMQIIDQVDSGLTLKADFELLKIVANNLIRNAIKYGAAGGRVMISAREEVDRVEVEVYNDGTPISAEDLDKLFKKFSKINDDRSGKEKGTGLGLYIVKQIIEKHNGTIRVEPRPTGNAFIFNIMKA